MLFYWHVYRKEQYLVFVYLQAIMYSVLYIEHCTRALLSEVISFETVYKILDKF